MLRRRPAVYAGLVSLIALAGAAGCTGGDDPSPSPSASAAAFVPGDKAPDGGLVREVESGFHVDMDGPDGMATFGVIVENTSKSSAAVGVTVTATFVTAAGAPLPLFGQAESLNSKAVTIPPGQRMGLGDLFDSSSGHDKRTPARMRLQIKTAGWAPAARVGGVAVSDVRYHESGGLPSFSLSVDSKLNRTLDDPRVVVIVRDKAGKIIGGLVPQKPQRAWPQGQSTQQVTLPTAAPPAADAASAEVYVGDADVDGRQV